MTKRWIRTGAAALSVAAVLAALTTAPASAAPGSSTAAGASPRPVVGTSTDPFAPEDSVLSARLGQVATATTLAGPQDRNGVEPSAAVGLPDSGAGSLLRGPAGYIVKIAVADTSARTRAELEAAGATIGVVDDGRLLLEATVAAESLVAVAGVPGVQWVHEELTPRITRSSSSTASASSTSSSSSTAGAAGPVTQAIGCAPVVTEGDAQLRATTARATYGLDGAGVKIGILSDSYDRRGGANTGVANGELPGPGNPCGHSTPVQVLQESLVGGADEGRGMAEIVHDLAPESPLAFASAFNGEMAFAANIRALAAAGAKVIVDDVSYYDEPVYQDGDVARAVNDVTAQGVVYYSSAGNENVLDDAGREVGSYEATGGFRPTTCPASTTGSLTDAGFDCHDFDPSGATSSFDQLTVAPRGSLDLTLGWNEPEYGITTDLALFVFDTTTGNPLLSGSNDVQDNIDHGEATRCCYIPTEFVSITNSDNSPHTYRIVVARKTGGQTPRFKLVLFTTDLVSAQFHSDSGGDVLGPTIYGHNATLAGASVAAVAYNSSTKPEDYSSRGPATYCWAPVTGSHTPAAAIDCQTKALDFAATDGGQTSFFFGGGPPFRFFGTSAAAPHAAAVGALMLDARPCASPAQILDAQRSTARPVGGYGVDSIGSGLVDANAAVGTLATCPATVGTRYHPVDPTRVLESRPIVGNTGGYTTPWGAGVSRPVDVLDTDDSGVPASGVSAVVLNVTVTDTTTAGFLTVSPTGEPTPVASNLNWAPGTTIANLVTVKVGTGGRVSFFNDAGSANVIADVVGWYDADASANVAGGTLYNPTSPTRILESRPLAGNIGGYTTPWTAGVTRSLDVTGSITGVVPPDATAVVLNVTATDTTATGFLTVFPADVGSVPTASNVNWSPGRTIPNLVTVRLGQGGADEGKVKIFNAAGNAHVIADVVGYYRSTGAAFHPLSPVRIEESRFGTGNLVGRWTPGQTRNLDVTDTHGSGVPAAGVQAVVLNVTVTDTTTAGFLTLFPASASSVPNASNLNWSAGTTIPNLTITKVPTSGNDDIKIYNQAGLTNVLADVVGWFG